LGIFHFKRFHFQGVTLTTWKELLAKEKTSKERRVGTKAKFRITGHLPRKFIGRLKKLTKGVPLILTFFPWKFLYFLIYSGKAGFGKTKKSPL